VYNCYGLGHFLHCWSSILRQRTSRTIGEAIRSLSGFKPSEGLISDYCVELMDLFSMVVGYTRCLDWRHAHGGSDNSVVHVVWK